MKNLIKTTLVAMILTSSVMADVYVKGGVSTSEIDSTTPVSTTAYELAVGGDGHFESTGGLLLGGEVGYGTQSYEFSSGTIKDMQTFGGQIHLGWTFFNDLDIYGIAGYYATVMDYTYTDGSIDALNGSGLRYGAGIDYTIWEHLSVGVEYTTSTYNLENSVTTAELGTQIYNNIGGNIKFRF